MRPRMIQELRADFDRAPDGVARERILVEVLARAQTVRTAYGAATIASLFPYPPIPEAIRARWQPRLEALEAFFEYLEGLDAWLNALPPSKLVRWPHHLYPSRAAATAHAWAMGKNAVTPDILRAQIVNAQSLILPTV